MLFAVHDSKVNGFNPPFAAPTPGTAERNFRTACSEPGSDFHRYPGDFNLYQVGYYESHSGLVEACIPPQFVCSAITTELAEVRRAS